jgi:MinD-like ATPase involved in chromosome partitioning or flagellar assembly
MAGPPPAVTDTAADTSAKDQRAMTGTVVTFYSLTRETDPADLTASAATALWSRGFRVLCVDWDADKPDLTAAVAGTSSRVPHGLADLIQDVRMGTGLPVDDYVFSTTKPGLRLLAANGRVDTDWQTLYEEYRLADFLEDRRAHWIEDFDYVLIKSPPGYGDDAAICCAQLADRLVVLHRDIRGVVDVVAQFDVARDRMPYDRPQLRTLPVLARPVPQAQFVPDLDAVGALTRNWLHRDVPIAELRDHLVFPGDELSLRVVTSFIAQDYADPDLLAYPHAANLVDVARVVEAMLDRELDSIRWELAQSTLDEMVAASYANDAAVLADLALELNHVGVGRAAEMVRGPVTGPPESVRQTAAKVLAELEARR